jgi:hypothetical protein
MGRLNRSIIVIKRTKFNFAARGIWQTRFCGLVLLVLAGCTGPAERTVLRFDCNSVPPAVSTYEEAVGLYQQVLDDYVREDGRIDYRKLAEDVEARNKLDCFLLFIGNIDPVQSMIFDNEKSRLAFYLNVYNAGSLRGGLEFYPQGKIPADFGSVLIFSVAGQEMSLAQIAEQMTVETDWRILPALSQPRLSGPYLAKKIYRGEQLEEQFDQALKDYLGSCGGFQIDFDPQRVLFGELIYNRKDHFVDEYKQRYEIENVSLISALIPYAWPKTQEQLADVAGFGIGKLPVDDRINDVERENSAEEGSQEEYRICGCK